MSEQRAFSVHLAGYDPGIYWTASPSEAKAVAWRHFSEVSNSRRALDFWRGVKVRRAPAFDGAYRGRQGLLPDFAAPDPAPARDLGTREEGL